MKRRGRRERERERERDRQENQIPKVDDVIAGDRRSRKC